MGWGVAFAHAALAFALVARDGLAAAADEHLTREEEIAAGSGEDLTACQILEVRAQISRVLGDEPACQRYLHQAQRRYAEMGASGHASRIESLRR